jgi:hypothetical protein
MLIRVLMLLFFACNIGFAADNEPINLCKMKGAVIKGFGPVFAADSLEKEKKKRIFYDSIDIVFPSAVTIDKIIIDTPKVQAESVYENPDMIPGLRSFEVLYHNVKADTYTVMRTYTDNSQYKIEIKQRVKTDTIRLKINNNGQVKDGIIENLQIFGYEGDAPAKKKMTKETIKTKAEAGEALRNGDISSQEYVDVMKTLQE